LDEPTKLPSPPYVAVSVLDPATKVVIEHERSPTGAVQEFPSPSETATFPVGSPEPGGVTETSQLTR